MRRIILNKNICDIDELLPPLRRRFIYAPYFCGRAAVMSWRLEPVFALQLMADGGARMEGNIAATVTRSFSDWTATGAGYTISLWAA